MTRRLSSTDVDDLVAAERDVRARLSATVPPLDIDLGATSVMANVFRVASTARSVFERRVLAQHHLSFTAFTVLWVLWIWGEQEFRRVAAESGITKGTLTGVLATLESRGLVSRYRPERDRRKMLVSATDKAVTLMEDVFPDINVEESAMVSRLGAGGQAQLAGMLREVLRELEPMDNGDGTVRVSSDG